MTDKEAQTKLLKKSHAAISRDILLEHYKEEFNGLTENEIEFYINFIITGKKYKSYQNAFNKNMTRGVAAVLANRLLKKIKISFVDYLDIAGHDNEKIKEALDSLFKSNKDKYLNHIIKFKQLDVQKIEHSGSLTIEYEKGLDD